MHFPGEGPQFLSFEMLKCLQLEFLQSKKSNMSVILIQDALVSYTGLEFRSVQWTCLLCHEHMLSGVAGRHRFKAKANAQPEAEGTWPHRSQWEKPHTPSVAGTTKVANIHQRHNRPAGENA